jgi:hypothetical protein
VAFALDQSFFCVDRGIVTANVLSVVYDLNFFSQFDDLVFLVIATDSGIVSVKDNSVGGVLLSVSVVA